MPETEREKRMIRGKGALSLNSIADVWKNVLDRLRSQLSETTINTWFDEVEVVTMEDSAFVLHCSNSFKKSTIEARFMSHIKAALKDIFSSDLEVKILDDQQLSAYHGVAPDRPGSLLESDAFTFGTYVVGPQNKMAYAAARDIRVDIRQSNHEGVLIDEIQAADGVYDGIVINPGAYTHYSYAIYDALLAVSVPAIEVHLSNINRRESFRRISVTAPACRAQIVGHGFLGYMEAMDLLAGGGPLV